MNGFFCLECAISFIVSKNLQLIVNVAPFLVVSMPPPGVHSFVPLIFFSSLNLFMKYWCHNPSPDCSKVSSHSNSPPYFTVPRKKSVACIITWHSFMSKCLFPFKFSKTHQKNPKYTLDYYLSVFFIKFVRNAIRDLSRPVAQALLVEPDA